MPDAYDPTFALDVLRLLAVMGMLLVACAATGLAVLRLAGWGPGTGLAPVVGLGVLLGVANVAVHTPLEGYAVAVILVLLPIAGAAWLAWRRALRPPSPGSVVLVSIAMLGTLLPFLAHGRVGVLGPGFNDDFAPHLYWAELLSGGRSLEGVADLNYPIGPHALAAGVAALVPPLEIELAFLGVALLAHVVLALAAYAALRDTPLVLRVPAAIAVSFPYLVVAYTGQGSFKEPLMATVLLGIVLVLWHMRTLAGRARWASLGVVLGLCLGVDAVYGRSGLVWPALILPFALAPDAWALRRRVSRRALMVAVPVALVLAALLVVVLLPTFRSVLDLRSDGGGNLPGFLPLQEVLGMWFSPDFRFPPEQQLRAGLWSGLALAAVLYGVLRAVERRDIAILAATAIVVGLCIPAQRSGPYFAAKALVIAAPFVVLMMVWGLVRDPARREWTWLTRGATALALVCLVGAAGLSTVAVLGNVRMSSLERNRELERVRATVEGKQVLYLGHDYFVYTKLRGAHISTLMPYSTANAAAVASAPAKPADRGNLFDWDSVTPESLDAVDYVLVPRGAYRSEPYENFRPVVRTESYLLYERDGTTEPRQSFDERTSPGTIMDCTKPEVAAIAKGPGTARVLQAPIVRDDTRWKNGKGDTMPPGLTPLGEPIVQRLTLPPGSWVLSMQYSSPGDLTVRAPGLERELPADPDIIGQFWHLGTVRSDGSPLELSVTTEAPVLPIRHVPSALGWVAASPLESGRRDVPLADACGQYVDWYRTGQ